MEQHEHCWHDIDSPSAESGERRVCCICAEEC